MDVPPQRTAIDWSWSWWERGLFGLVGAAAAIGALWLTFVALFVLGMGLECARAYSWGVFAEGLFVGAAIAAVASLPWLIALSLLRVAAGRRGLRKRIWFAVPAVAAVLSLIYLSSTLGQPPLSAETCSQSLEMS